MNAWDWPDNKRRNMYQLDAQCPSEATSPRTQKTSGEGHLERPDIFDSLDLLRSEHDFQSLDILLQMLDFTSPDDGAAMRDFILA